MIPIYSICTSSHRVLKERFFCSTLPRGLNLQMLDCEIEGAGWIMDASWRQTIFRKIEWIIEAIEMNWGGWFVFSDVDVQFFGTMDAPLIAAAAQYDLAFQADTPIPTLCTGFFVCRGNDATLALWRAVLQNVRACDGFKHDQEWMQRLIPSAKNIRWGYLPTTFFGGGTFTNRIWNPGDELPVPEGVVMHHANFTCGVPNKIEQCEHVRAKVLAAKVPEVAATMPAGDLGLFLRA
jgi:hypothetical protein